MATLGERASRLRYLFGSFSLDPAERRLVRGNEEVRLSPKVFETLVYLVERRGLLVDKEELMKMLWPDTFVEEVTLARNISLLRKALGDLPGQDQSRYIETVSKRGYRFIAPVTEVQSSLTVESSELPIDKLELPIQFRKRKRPSVWISIAGLTVLLVGIAFWWHRSFRGSAAQIQSLAVLPFENLSGNADQEYFSDGITDELITDLAQIHSLRVISRTSVMQFKHTKKTLPEVAAQLKADAIVEGSVSRDGDKVHITVQLLDAKQDRHLWAGNYEHSLADISGVKSQITRAIADELKVGITPQEDNRLTKSRPHKPEAYEAILRGRFLRARKMGNTPQALPFFLQAVAIDPTYADAWAELADSYGHMGAELGMADPAEMRAKADGALAKALELNPDLAQAHATSGWLKLWYDWDWAGAEREFRRAIELSPNDSITHRYYTHYLRSRGRFDEALEENRRAMDLAPLDMLPQANLAWIYQDARMADKTIEQSKHLIAMDPNFVNGYFYLAHGYELKGQWAEAIATYEEAQSKTNEGAYLLQMSHVLALSGDRQKAEVAWANLLKGAVKAKARITPYMYAEFYGALGEHDKAIEQLEQAYREHAAALLGLKVSPSFDSLRSDPRFLELERKVGF